MKSVFQPSRPVGNMKTERLTICVAMLHGSAAFVNETNQNRILIYRQILILLAFVVSEKVSKLYWRTTYIPTKKDRFQLFKFTIFISHLSSLQRATGPSRFYTSSELESIHRISGSIEIRVPVSANKLNSTFCLNANAVRKFHKLSYRILKIQNCSSLTEASCFHFMRLLIYVCQVLTKHSHLYSHPHTCFAMNRNVGAILWTQQRQPLRYM